MALIVPSLIEAGQDYQVSCAFIMQSRHASHSRIVRLGLVRFTVILAILLAVGFAFGQIQKEPYKLGPEDVFNITVQRHVEWSGDLLVPADGVVDIPVVGSTNVAGKTLTEIRDLILKALAKRIHNPEATVTLRIARQRRVYVEGVVKLATALDYKPGWRISEAIAGAGGIPDTVQSIDCRVTLLHASTGQIDEVSLPDVYAGLPSANLPVQPGDVVTVKTLEAVSVYVVGQVRTPGLIRLRVDNVGLMTAIAMAGGLLPTSSTSSVTITHLNGKSEKIDITPIAISGEKIPVPNLQAGDLVNVPELQARFAIQGLVKSPGIFPYQDGKVFRLSDAISMAGGSDSHRARLSKVALLRDENGKMKRMIINYGAFLSKGDRSQDIILRPGDVVYVPETNSIDWQVIFNGLISTYYVINATHL